MNIKLNLKVLLEIQDDLNKVEFRINSSPYNTEDKQKLLDEVWDLKESSKKLFNHYQRVISRQV